MKSFRRTTIISKEFNFQDLTKEGGFKVKYPRIPTYIRATMFYHTEYGWQNFDKDLKGYMHTLGYDYKMDVFNKKELIITATPVETPPSFRMLAIIDVWYD